MDNIEKELDALEKRITTTEPKSAKISNEFEQRALDAINSTCGYQDFDPNEHGIIQELGILEFRNKDRYSEIAKYIMERPTNEIDGVTQIKEMIRNREEISSAQLSVFWNENNAPYSGTLKYKEKHLTNPVGDVSYTTREQFILKCYYRKHLAILFAIQILHYNELLINYTNDCDKEEYLNDEKKGILLSLGFDFRQILNFYDIQIEALMSDEKVDVVQEEIKVEKDNNLKKVLRILAWIFVIPGIIILVVELYKKSRNLPKASIEKIKRISIDKNDIVRNHKLTYPVEGFSFSYKESINDQPCLPIDKIHSCQQIKDMFFHDDNTITSDNIAEMDITALNNKLPVQATIGGTGIEKTLMQSITYTDITSSEKVVIEEEQKTVSLITIQLQINTSNPAGFENSFRERAHGLDIDFGVAYAEITLNELKICLEGYDDVITNKEHNNENIVKLFATKLHNKVITQEEIETIIKEEFEPSVIAKDAAIKARLTSTLITTTQNRKNP